MQEVIAPRSNPFGWYVIILRLSCSSGLEVTLQVESWHSCGWRWVSMKAHAKQLHIHFKNKCVNCDPENNLGEENAAANKMNDNEVLILNKSNGNENIRVKWRNWSWILPKEDNSWSFMPMWLIIVISKTFGFQGTNWQERVMKERNCYLESSSGSKRGDPQSTVQYVLRHAKNCRIRHVTLVTFDVKGK